MITSSEHSGTLYIVATPIGNLDDISLRALKILHLVDVIAAEDTRHSKRLLEAHQISKPMLSLHEHNESARIASLLARIAAGESVALISDAGTPTISDPGYLVVKAAREAQIPVIPVPGACAAITALSGSGLATDRFLFVGFLSSKSGPRKQELAELLQQRATIVLYESPRRIIDLLEAIADIAPERELCLAKELTKSYERFLFGMAHTLIDVLQNQPELQKGEWVVMVSAAPKVVLEIDRGVVDAVELAAQEMPLKKACELLAKITGHKKNQLYSAVQACRNND